MKDYSALSLKNYLNELASDAPVPGGGSVSAYSAALALGLMQMVAGITLKRKIKPELSAEEKSQEEKNKTALREIVSEVEMVKNQAMQVVSTDPQVYDEVMNAYARKASEAEIDAALLKAFQLQSDLSKKIAQALDLNGKLAGLVKGSIKNDLIVAQHLLKAAFQGAYHTAHINIVCLKDAEKKALAEKELAATRTNFGITGTIA
jgi:formiminotetrahydrofolate cyclodeaminase